MTDCIFCKIVEGQIPTEFVYEDDKIVIFKDIRPKAEVHLLIVAREHIPSLAEATQDNASLLAHMTLVLPKIAKEQGLNSGFRTVINTGKGGGQEIDHIHFHLLGGGMLPKF